MKVVQCLCEVLAHAVLMSHPGVHGEEGDVLQVHRSLPALQEDAEGGLGIRDGGGEDNLILLPLCGTDVHPLLDISLPFAHIFPVDEFHANRGVSSVRNPGPDAEAVLGPFFKSYSKEAVVLQPRMLVGVSGIRQAHIVGIPVKRSVFPYFHIAEGGPPLEGINRKFE